MFEEIVFYIVTLLLSIFAFLIYKIYKYSLEKALLKHVSWCATNNSNIFRDNLNLLEWLCNVPSYSVKKRRDCFFPNADKLFPIHNKYCLQNDEERSTAKEILHEYQKELIQEFFSGHLVANRFVCKLTNVEYFLLSLKEFLKKYQCETTFHGNKMYNTKEYKSCGSWGVPLFDATYELTDFAVVYHKVYYIAQMYCLTLRENPLDTNTVYFQSAEYTQKVLDTREIQVSRY